MNMALPQDQQFQVQVLWPQTGEKETLNVIHRDETFEFTRLGQKVSILNSGDNAWDLIEGQLDQQTVNLIGDAIEKHYNNQQLS
jgi:hypothetical protein